MKICRHHVLGAPVDAVNMAEALEFVSDYIARPENPLGYILAVNPEKVYVLRENRELCDFFEKATLLLPDGIGVVKALNFLYRSKTGRVPGADLMQNICREAPEKGYRLFVFGASEEVNAEACARLVQKHPGIRIVGRANGFIPDGEMPALVQRINDSGAQILFIAMGSPRQEKWMEQYGPQLTSVKLCQGIGGTLDTITGAVKRAPLFWQNLGLEWFYRLLNQPTRLGRQLRLGKFVFEVIGQKISRGGA